MKDMLGRFFLPALLLLSTPMVAQADDVPGDVRAYMDRRAACNYWPHEKAHDKVRRAEIERHARNLHCDTLGHELAILDARYQARPELIEALRDAEYAVPE